VTSSRFGAKDSFEFEVRGRWACKVGDSQLPILPGAQIPVSRRPWVPEPPSFCDETLSWAPGARPPDLRRRTVLHFGPAIFLRSAQVRASECQVGRGRSRRSLQLLRLPRALVLDFTTRVNKSSLNQQDVTLLTPLADEKSPFTSNDAFLFH
jgi:hypothetical protein